MGQVEAEGFKVVASSIGGHAMEVQLPHYGTSVDWLRSRLRQGMGIEDSRPLHLVTATGVELEDSSELPGALQESLIKCAAPELDNSTIIGRCNYDEERE